MGGRRLYIYYSQYAFIYAWNENRDVNIYTLFLPHYTIILYKLCTCEAELGGLRMRGEAHGSTLA